jgi:hypothetical protein
VRNASGDTCMQQEGKEKQKQHDEGNLLVQANILYDYTAVSVWHACMVGHTLPSQVPCTHLKACRCLPSTEERHLSRIRALQFETRLSALNRRQKMDRETQMTRSAYVECAQIARCLGGGYLDNILKDSSRNAHAQRSGSRTLAVPGHYNLCCKR